ncbi:hypothetical protein PIB30_100169 [Stylosanthes scabra]|uniref:Putative plant transposon protein domain-containing protein n=1 Tax=Stylosanthes scabra TaxID=79078 RepID=A0ABU6UXX3_9FABA|nr:hypothetical protein [Stylosanthes scabra]
MEESIHVVFDETNSCNARKDISDEFVEMMDSLNLDGEEKLEESKEVNLSENDDQVPIVETTQEQHSELPKDWRTVKDHPLDNVIGEITKGVTTRSSSRPIQLRRQELNPVARGWHEFSIHSLIPSSNRSEIPVIRAILIHCIMRGEDVRAEDIIADKIVRMAQGIKEKGKLGFPSTIYKL